MEEMQTQLILNNLTDQIRCLSIDKEKIKKILRLLIERCQSARDLELTNLKQLDQTEEEFENSKMILAQAFQVRMTVNGTEGKQLVGNVDDIIDSPNFPDDVESIYISSDSVLKGVYNYTPRNSFQIFFDFKKPNILDFSLTPSQATPNNSNITVSGYDATWAHGVFNELDTFLKKSPSKLNWIHKNGVYDFLLWLGGLPFGFWLCYIVSNLVVRMFGSFSVFVQNAVYVYFFLIALFGCRVLFHYARWIYPTVEYSSSNNKGLKHRVAIATLSLGVLSSVIASIVVDICKT